MFAVHVASANQGSINCDLSSREWILNSDYQTQKFNSGSSSEHVFARSETNSDACRGNSVVTSFERQIQSNSKRAAGWS